VGHAERTEAVAVISPSSGGPVTDEEIDSVFGEARERMVWGRNHYGDSFNRADLKTDIREELLDLINYATLMLVRLERLIPDFAGRTSAEIVGKR
jgi:hypothetical protein